MFQVLSELKPSWQPDLEVWNKDELSSFQKAKQPPAPVGDQEEPEPPERKMRSSVMSQASKQSETLSYETYLVELHPMDPGRPDRQLHDFGQQRLNRFLRHVSRRPQRFEDEVKMRRGGPVP